MEIPLEHPVFRHILLKLLIPMLDFDYLNTVCLIPILNPLLFGRYATSVHSLTGPHRVFHGQVAKS